MDSSKTFYKSIQDQKFLFKYFLYSCEYLGFDIFWEKGVFPNVDILFQSFNSNGQPLSDVPILVNDDEGYQFAPNIISGSSDSVFVVYADQGSGSVDLKVNYYKGVNSLLETGGLLAVKGLDGDIKYNIGFPIDDDKIVLVWEDNRASKKIYANVISSGELSHLNGNQISFSDNSSTEIDFFVIGKCNSFAKSKTDCLVIPSNTP